MLWVLSYWAATNTKSTLFLSFLINLSPYLWNIYGNIVQISVFSIPGTPMRCTSSRPALPTLWDSTSVKRTRTFLSRQYPAPSWGCSSKIINAPFKTWSLCFLSLNSECFSSLPLLEQRTFSLMKKRPGSPSTWWPPAQEASLPTLRSLTWRKLSG